MGMSLDEFDKFLREDIEKWGELGKDTGMRSNDAAPVTHPMSGAG